MSHFFSKEFVIPSFDYYTRVTDHIQHLRAYHVSMVAQFHDDLLMCRVFPSNLKGVSLNWFFSLSSWSLWNIEEVSYVFYNQYVSRQEFKKNNNHLFTVKMK